MTILLVLTTLNLYYIVMNEIDKEKARLLKLPLSPKLKKILEQLSIINSNTDDEGNKPKHKSPKN